MKESVELIYYEIKDVKKKYETIKRVNNIELKKWKARYLNYHVIKQGPVPIGLPNLEHLCFNEDLCPDDQQRRIALVEKT